MAYTGLRSGWEIREGEVVLLEHGYTPPFKALERNVGAGLRMSSTFPVNG